MYVQRQKGFTLIELLVVISIIALLIGILLPALGAARRTARQMQSNANVRSIHQAMVTFASGNGERFPGLDTRGRIEEAVDTDPEYGYGNPTDAGDGDPITGGHPATRYILLLQGSYFTGEIAISPADTKTIWTESSDPDDADKIQTANYSYAMLRLQDSAAEDETDQGEIGKFGRLPNEWRDTLNSEAPVVTDRNTGDDALDSSQDTNGAIKSIHTTEEGDWRGSVGYNDNHVEFENSHVLRTKWSNGNTMIDDNNQPLDNLFTHDEETEASSGSTPTEGEQEATDSDDDPEGEQGQAVMVYQNPHDSIQQK
ncbi:type II secretion system protein [Mucisphaera calidilacus]|uniref:Putative major pilin subunit n=1 Tax=Mucisphaera calidilacus TaxID=2527982 RepID=A0A518BZS0_9BACT|nr:type II secretion system protein [Mucisphaera calidilacus]QDU72465.1 putative major pilin subunit [Mucisphaera calidilacus]